MSYVMSPALFALCFLLTAWPINYKSNHLSFLNVNIVIGKVRLPHDNHQAVWDHQQVMFLPHLFVCLHTPVQAGDIQQRMREQLCHRTAAHISFV